MGDSIEEECADSGNQRKEDILRRFIEKYEMSPQLWNPSQSNYMNKTVKNAALEELKVIYSEMVPGCTIANVKRKINTLRSNYRKELKKILNSKKAGTSAKDMYTPTSWVFYQLQFLDKFEQPASCNQQNDKMLLTAPARSASNPAAAFQKDSPPSAASTSQPQPIKKQRVIGLLAKQNALIEKACSLLDQPLIDSTPYIARVWGDKLETLKPDQRLFAEKAINDILFEASLGLLNRYSVRINDPPQASQVFSNYGLSATSE